MSTQASVNAPVKTRLPHLDDAQKKRIRAEFPQCKSVSAFAAQLGCTAAQIENYAYRNGLKRIFGKKNNLDNITMEDVNQMRELRRVHQLTLEVIAEKFEIRSIDVMHLLHDA